MRSNKDNEQIIDDTEPSYGSGTDRACSMQFGKGKAA